MLRKQGVFIRRSYLIESSYKVSALMELSSSVFPLFLFYYIGKLVDHRASTVADYGGSYFSFALVGVGLSQFLSKALGIFSGSIRRAQMSGVLEASLSSKTSPVGVVLYDATFSFLVALVHLLLVFFVGGAFLGVSFANCNLASVALAGSLSLLSFVALGVLAATFVLVLKKGDPVQFVFGSAAMVLSGAYFPVSVMPESVQRLVQALPMTHALEALRLAILRGVPPAALGRPILVLAIIAVVLLPLSLTIFSLAVEKGRRDGTLLHY